MTKRKVRFTLTDVTDEVPTPTQEATDDRLVRALAELDNLRKRFEREREQLRQFGAEGLIRDLGPAIDAFRRAGDVPAELAQSSWVAGVHGVRQLIEQVLTKHGVTVIDPEPGSMFDANEHEAVGTVAAGDDYPDQSVVQLAGVGLKLHDRVLVPARVLVAA